MKLSLLIVDDDEVICRGIADCFNWQSYGISVIGTANNGEKALEMMQQRAYDILLTDIKMPFMDGMELSSVVAEKFPETIVILLSAYKDFSYAQKALNIGLFQYLTKPFSDAEIIRCVINARDKIIKEKEKKNKAELTVSHQMNKEFLSSILCGSGEGIDKHVLEYLGIPCGGYYYVIGIVKAQSDKIAGAEAGAADSNSMDGKFNCKFFGDIFNNNVIITFSNISAEHCKYLINNYCRKLSKTFFINTPNMHCYGISQPFHDVGQLSIAYIQAKMVLAVSDCNVNGTIYDYCDSFRENHCILIKYHEMIEKIIFHLQREDINAALNAVDGLFEKVRLSVNMTLSVARFIVIDLLTQAYRNFYDNEEERMVSVFSGFIEDIFSSDSLIKLANIVRKELSIWYHQSGEYKEIGGKKIVTKIKQYLKLNYGDPELNLGSVSEQFHISASYLCYLIKKYEGNSFVNYLTSIRIDNAKTALLCSDINTYELSQKVGFNSPQYFNSCFKKHTGLTPGEFRLNSNIFNKHNKILNC